MAVRIDLNLSLDGVAVTTDQTPENPMGDDWGRLVAAYVGTRTFRERVLHETTGEGTTGIDDRYATAYFDEVGAEIMGAGMFGLHSFPDDPHWRGWWGEEPPFHVPVLVLTHRERPAIDFANGTRDFLRAGLVDRLHVAITPIVLGRGVRLWDDLPARERRQSASWGYRARQTVRRDGWDPPCATSSGCRPLLVHGRRRA